MVVDNTQPLKRGHDQAFDPSAFPIAGPSSAKKGKKNKDEEPVEKRARLFKRTCPKAIQERCARVYSQRFFCVGRNKTSETSEEFTVLGSTTNVYTVRIKAEPSCSCPDGAKGNHCKHILFVMLKILQVPQTSNLWYQAALLSTELSAIFANQRPAPAGVAEQRAAKMYKVATGQEQVDETDPNGSSGLVQKRLPEEDDDCSVCYESLTPGSEVGLVFCLGSNGCGRGLHAECQQQWARQAQPVTCVNCRAEWSSGAAVDPKKPLGPTYSEGYLNLSGSLGVSPQRDTSSYYRGPQRGRGWDGGYGRYGDDDWY